MRFGNLLKKELSELFTKQAIISMIFTMVLLIAMGQFMGKAMEESINISTITICNQDNTEFTNAVLKNITESKTAEINYVDIQSDDYASELGRLDVNNVVIIPTGYSDSILIEKKPATLKYVSILPASGLSSTMSGISSADVINYIQNASTDEILLQSYGISESEIERIKEPTSLTEYTVSGKNTVQVSSTSLSGIIMMQSLIAPMVIFFLLLMAAQMIMTAISTEKIDKTLETLLSTPVSRMSVLSAKMLAAVIAALANAVFMMIGFIFYINGMSGNIVKELSSNIDASSIAASAGSAANAGDAMTALGLTLSPVSYILFGLQLFLTLAIGLSVSLILGAMATDVKSVQTLVLPIMITVMIPFLVTMFTDVNSMSLPIKTIMYIIPFTHTYTALTNLMNGDMLIFWAGLAYQFVFFIVCMYLAVKMFTTDKLFTMSFTVDASKKKTSLKFKKA